MRYQRFHTLLSMADSEQVQRLLTQLLDVDQVDRIALVATATDDAGRESLWPWHVRTAHRAKKKRKPR
ncbi:MAG: hypothetical protein HZY76_17700 [Anaerolineae bacterium]|nr:MAG: hypothetical protein HZY76_17700 [Anaerolineae bacterium]